MRSEEIRLNYSNSLANDYLQDFSRVQEFFTYNPFKPESFIARSAHLDNTYSGERRSLVTQVMREYNSGLGAGPETLASVEVFSRPDALAVVTGQQAGILGGPLYSVYKALTAIQLASRMSKELARPVVPIFWIAAEDHDYTEVNEVNVLDREGQKLKLALDYQPDRKYSIGDIAVPNQFEALLADLGGLTQDTEFKAGFLELLRKSAQESENLADWFGRILLDWLGPLGLILINPLDKRLRALESEIFTGAIDRFSRINDVVSGNGAALAAKGYPVSVSKDSDNVNLFMYMEQERLALTGSAEGFKLKGREHTFGEEELLAIIAAEPERFSPNVVLRPLTQDVLLPTLAYVGGPGEISYCCQYKGVYELFNMEMPIIFPRANLTLVEGGSEKYLRKYQVSLEDLFNRQEEIQQENLKQRDEVGIDQIFADLEEKIAAAYVPVVSAIKGLDPALGKLGEENKERVISQVNWLRGKTLQAHRKANDVFIRQFRKLCSSLAPNGQLQERVYGGALFVLKYGPAIWRDLARVDLTSNTLHKVIYLADA